MQDSQTEPIPGQDSSHSHSRRHYVPRQDISLFHTGLIHMLLTVPGLEHTVLTSFEREMDTGTSAPSDDQTERPLFADTYDVLKDIELPPVIKRFSSGSLHGYAIRANNAIAIVSHQLIQDTAQTPTLLEERFKTIKQESITITIDGKEYEIADSPRNFPVPIFNRYVHVGHNDFYCPDTAKQVERDQEKRGIARNQPEPNDAQPTDLSSHNSGTNISLHRVAPHLLLRVICPHSAAPYTQALSVAGDAIETVIKRALQNNNE